MTTIVFFDNEDLDFKPNLEYADKTDIIANLNWEGRQKLLTSHISIFINGDKYMLIKNRLSATNKEFLAIRNMFRL